MGKTTIQYLLTGILFAALWASASSAGKFGLQSAEGLVLFSYRFIIAGLVLLTYSALIQRDRFPVGKEWVQLLVFALFNTALYLGVFIVALEEVTAGITTIALALNPLLISSMTSLWTRRPITLVEWLSLLIGIIGVVLAAFPLLQNSHATLLGLILLGSCMVFYSFGSVYYATVPWKLSRTAINGWQVLLGGLMLIPFAVFFHRKENQFDFRFWFSIGWLVLPVSVGAVQLWLYLLKTDAVRASLWLFLCPIFGLLYAAWLLAEPVTLYTIVGLLLVLLALILGQRPVVPKANKA